MTNRKKVNTLDLIQQMTEKNKETLNAVDNLKQERSENIGVSGTKQHFGPKSVRKEARTPKPKGKGTSEEENPKKKKVLQQLKVVLNTEAFRDGKATFTLSLSRECLDRYEKMATGISYKLGTGTSRNDLIRKVLERFIMDKYEKTIKEIELK